MSEKHQIEELRRVLGAILWVARGVKVPRATEDEAADWERRLVEAHDVWAETAPEHLQQAPQQIAPPDNLQRK